MKYLNLNLFKRILLQVLLITVHMTYGIPAKAYTISTNATTCPGTSGNMICLRLTSWGQNFVQYGTSLYYSLYSKACLCMSTTEIQNATSKCQAVACSTKYPNTTGYLRWDLTTSSCNGTIDCRANPGYYAYSTTYASPCPTGHRCSGGYMVSQNGVSSASKIACSINYYQNSTGQSTCKSCPSMGGVSGKTKTTGTIAMTTCYVPSNTMITDANGNKYISPDNCYYSV